MLQTPPSRTLNGSGSRSSQPRQSSKLFLALGILLVLLVAVLVKDRDFWFGIDRATIESDMPEAAAPAAQAPAKATTASVPVTQTAAKKQPSSTKAAPKVVSHAAPAEQAPVAIHRTVLPPLQVEVVAGSKHHTLRPGNNATKLAVENSDSSALKQSDLAAATKAAEREQLSAEVSQPQYPLLAHHMNVMGSVVLQALIGSDGVIENLRVMSGPAILANAAQQAVREWKFKPIQENGQAVESKAVITVNFSIRVADNPSNPTIAHNQPERIEILR